MKGMEVIHFVENLERGGLERTVIDLIAAQRDAGHTCRVICLFEPGQLANELTGQGVEVTACHKRRGMDWAAVRRARALLRRHPGAVLHTHNATAHYHAVLAALGLPLARVINSRHSMGAKDPRSRKEWLYRRSMRLTDYVAGVCEAARECFADQGVRPRQSLLAVPNGIRLERFQVTDAARRAALAAELGWPADSRVIGTVGRLQPVKDQQALLRAFAQVRVNVPKAVLAVVGDGNLRAPLERLAGELELGDAVRFLGDRSDVPRLLTGMEVFALSSLSEGYSIALLEACAAALPIVATDVGGNREIVRDGRNGRLVAPGDPAGLAEALQAVLAAPEAAERMGQAGRDWVLAEGSFRTMALRYERLYAGHSVSADEPAAETEAV